MEAKDNVIENPISLSKTCYITSQKKMFSD